MRKKQERDYRKLSSEIPQELEEAQQWLEAHREDKIVSCNAMLNNDRRHREKRDRRSINLWEQQPYQEEEYTPIPHLIRLHDYENWLDLIYSGRPEDLPHLAENEALYRALNSLTKHQLTIIYKHLIWGYTTEEIAQQHGTSQRNIQDVLRRSWQRLRQVMEHTTRI